MPEIISQSFRTRVFYAAKDGMAITLYALLSEKSDDEAEQLLNEHYVENGQRCTPLIIAAKCGHKKTVQLILSKFKPDLEQEGTVKFDGYVIEGASALWCAAGAGHLNVVKTLVKAGANVNHPTRTNSTPLRAACFDGSLDIVKYLTDHNADINIANKYNNTCLMIAAFKGHLDVVSFLLQNKANPDVKALCGATALHFAAECGHTAIVRELLDYGAQFYKNENGMTPLIAAAERTRSEVVEYLITRPEISFEEQIEALELLGASYANDKDNYCLELAYEYLHRSMELRYKDPDNVIRKKVTTPIPAYGNRIECQTLADLEAIRFNHNAIHMEALTIRERILGSNNPEIPHPIIFRGAVFADNARFDRCIDLWLRALYLRQTNNDSVFKDLLRCAQVFSQMIHIGEVLSVDHVITVLQSTVRELEQNQRKIDNPGPKDDVDTIKNELDGNYKTALYLINIFTKLMKSATADENFAVRKLIYALHQLKLYLRDGKTLLHLAVHSETQVDDFHISDVCKFPCAATTKLLLNSGADVNAMDCDRNTPLHNIVSYEKPISDFLTLHTIIIDLTEAGAHMDAVNANGETPIQASATNVAEIILRTQMKLSLKCMAAKAVKAHNLTYQGQVPRSLETFIEMHGKGAIKQG